MHQALVLVARAIALAHDHWRRSVGRRLSLSGHVAVLEENIRRLEAENALLRARLGRVPARRRPARAALLQASLQVSGVETQWPCQL